MSPNDVEKRSNARLTLEKTIRVTDVMTERELGTIVNLHQQGFMMIGDGPVREDHVYQLVFHMSDIDAAAADIRLGAECLWVKESDSCTQHWSGFQIIDAKHDELRRIVALVGGDNSVRANGP